MKNFKFIIIALVVLALLIAAYFLVKNLSTDTSDEDVGVSQTSDGEIVVYNCSDDYAISLNYSNSLGDASFVKRAEVWSATVDQSMPIDQEHLEEMTSALGKVTATRDITDGADESAYGFEEPTLSYTVQFKGGTSQSVVVGDYNELSGGYYLKHKDRIYIVDSTVVDALSHSLFDALVRTELPTIATEDITSLTVNGQAGDPAGFANIGITVVEDYKNKESYGFDGSENVVAITYNEAADITDDAGNVTSTVDVEKSYTFSYVIKDNITYFMLPDDTNIYQGTGTEALFPTAEEESVA